MPDVFLELALKMRHNGFWFDESNEPLRMEQCYMSEDILKELSRFIHGDIDRDTFIDNCLDIANRPKYWSTLTEKEFNNLNKETK